MKTGESAEARGEAQVRRRLNDPVFSGLLQEVASRWEPAVTEEPLEELSCLGLMF